MKQHSGSLSGSAQTAAFAATWPVEVPPVYAVQTVWAQAALATLERIDLYGVRPLFNVGGLHAKTLVHNPQLRGLVLASLRTNLRRTTSSRAGLALAFLLSLLGEGATRARGLFYRVAKRGYYRFEYSCAELGSIEEAAADLKMYLEQTRSFESVWKNP